VNGRINGTVSDSSGAVVPNAAVTITNTATNATRTAVTDEGGFYTVTSLPVGTYTVTVERSGFKKANQAGNVLTADQRLTVNITLEAGNVTETVEVTTVAGETVNTTSGEVARVVDSRQVQNLALNGRNYMQLVTLIPGAVILDEDQLGLTTSLSISHAAINGNRPNYNNLTVDGGSNMDSGSNNSQINTSASISSRKLRFKPPTSLLSTVATQALQSTWSRAAVQTIITAQLMSSLRIR
jgi:hypothetical protein